MKGIKFHLYHFANIMGMLLLNIRKQVVTLKTLDEPPTKTFRRGGGAICEQYIHSIQDYLYGTFDDTIVAKQLYRKLSFYIAEYLIYGKIWDSYNEMHYMNAWLKRCVFNLDLNRESVSEHRTLSGRYSRV